MKRVAGRDTDFLIPNSVCHSNAKATASNVTIALITSVLANVIGLLPAQVVFQWCQRSARGRGLCLFPLSNLTCGHKISLGGLEPLNLHVDSIFINCCRYRDLRWIYGSSIVYKLKEEQNW